MFEILSEMYLGLVICPYHGFPQWSPLLYLVEFGFASMKLVISGTFLCGQIHILNPLVQQVDRWCATANLILCAV